MPQRKPAAFGRKKWVIGAPILIALQFLVASNPLSGQERFPDPIASELQRIVESSREAIPIPGISIGVVLGGEVAYARGFGYADLSTKKPITPDTIFQIGSISKSFTATLAALLVEQGELAWDDPLSKHIPHASLPHRSITLAHLAQHTSGLPGDPPTLRRQHGDYPILAFTHFELYRALAETTLQVQPGSNWGYSNFGYAVLGHGLEMKTGTPYEVLVGRQLFEPLEMTSSTITLWPESTKRLAKPYYLQNGTLTEYPAPWDEEALAPAGGIASTVNDLTRYLIYQIRMHDKAGAVAKLQQTHVETPHGSQYGMGWFIEELPGVGKAVSVGGDVDGYVGELVFAPQQKIGTVILVNSGDAAPLPFIGRWLITGLLGKTNSSAAAEARYYRGMIDQATGDWGSAVDAFSSLASRTPPHRRALYQLGRTAALSGEHLDLGTQALEEYLRHDPLPGISHADASWRLGQIHERAERWDAATAAYREALEREADHEPARSALRELRKRRSDRGRNTEK